jgi:hypothetical protein
MDVFFMLVSWISDFDLIGEECLLYRNNPRLIESLFMDFVHLSEILNK